MASNEIVEVLYIGFGGFLPGVPARDLTAEEWLGLPDETRELALALDLYQVDRGQEKAGAEGSEMEGGADGREDEGVVDDGATGAADGGARHRGVSRRRG